MGKQEILSQLNTLFIDILDNEDIVLTESSSANDIEEWDSLTHIQLIVSIEKHFKMRFTSAEINGLKNVGEMCGLIHSKLST